MKTSQEEQVLNHLLSGKTITPLEALKKYNSFRLSAIIYNLRAKGYDIITNNVNKKGKYFAEYHIRSFNLAKKIVNERKDNGYIYTI
jgi:hypothetical protein